MVNKYRSEVRQFYELQKDQGNISLNLIYPTPGRLRNECMSCFQQRLIDVNVNRMLRDFLKQPIGEHITLLHIKRVDIDIFKPLCNFLKKEIKTNEKNLELLAWLIDFHPRPFSNYWRKRDKPTADDSCQTVQQEQVSRPTTITNNFLSFYNQTPKGILSSYNFESISGKSKVVLEYPSGIKVTVDASNIMLISELLKL